jgi:hypothetical protein
VTEKYKKEALATQMGLKERKLMETCEAGTQTQRIVEMERFEKDKRDAAASLRATTDVLSPLHQRFMTQEGKRHRAAFSPPHDPSFAAGVTPLQVLDKVGRSIEFRRKRRAGGTLDGSLNSQAYTINFIKKKFSGIDQLVDK